MQLCQLASDWRGYFSAGGMMYEEKRNGWRGIVFQGIDGATRMFTRNGQFIEGTSHILYMLSHMERATGEPMVWDGEFQVGDSLDATKHWAETGHKLGGEAGHFHLFDCLPLSAWKRGGDDTPLYLRKARLKELYVAVMQDDTLSWEWRAGSRGDDSWRRSVSILPDQWAFDAHDVLRGAREVWARDGEGIMLKDPESPYRRGRTTAWLKVKRENAHRWSMAA